MGDQELYQEELGEEAQEVQQFVCFKLADEEYAMDIQCVQEVIRVKRITPVPQMPEFCRGVVNIRGNVIAIFDLRKVFHLPEKPLDEASKFLITKVDDVMMGLIVDEILDNIKLEPAEIDPTPTVKMKIEKECVKGLGSLEGRMIVIIDLSVVHNNISTIITESDVDKTAVS